MSAPDIWFVNLGLRFSDWAKSFSVFGYEIYFYGVIIAIGMLAGITLAAWIAKRTGQDSENYFELAIIGGIFAIIGARLYYVAFAWDSYKDDLLQILNLRAGGLAIYGGVIAGVLTALVFAKVKKLPFKLIMDTAAPGLILGQCIGRWSNFFNMECFGGYTDNIFAMALNTAKVNYSMITDELIEHSFVSEGVTYIQVHPTFLYESLWSLGTLILLLIFLRRKKFDGEIFLLYLIGYGSGRAWIEGLRTDQLKWAGTDIAVSQVLSVIVVIAAVILLVIGLVHASRGRLTTTAWLSPAEAKEKAESFREKESRRAAGKKAEKTEKSGKDREGS